MWGRVIWTVSKSSKIFVATLVRFYDLILYGKILGIHFDIFLFKLETTCIFPDRHVYIKDQKYQIDISEAFISLFIE